MTRIERHALPNKVDIASPLASFPDTVDVLDLLKTADISEVIRRPGEPLVDYYRRLGSDIQDNYQNAPMIVHRNDNNHVDGMLLYAVGRPAERSAILALAVQEQARHQKIGKRLVNHATRLMRDAGANEVGLFSTNEAIPFYERIGFTNADKVFQFPAGTHFMTKSTSETHDKQ